MNGSRTERDADAAVALSVRSERHGLAGAVRGDEFSGGASVVYPRGA